MPNVGIHTSTVHTHRDAMCTPNMRACGVLILEISCYTCTHHTSAPGAPPSLTASSVNVTGITIQWDPVLCQDRNQLFNSYVVYYYPSSDQTAGSGMLLPEDDRVFSITGLPPRTSYTFQVQAFNLFPSVQGLFASLSVNTSDPPSKLFS